MSPRNSRNNQENLLMLPIQPKHTDLTVFCECSPGKSNPIAGDANCLGQIWRSSDLFPGREHRIFSGVIPYQPRWRNWQTR